MSFSIKFNRSINPSNWENGSNGADFIHVSFERSLDNELKNYPEYVTKMRTLQRIHLTNTCERPVMTVNDFETDTDWLQSLYFMGFKYACIWFEGSWPHGQDFEEEALKYCNGLEGEWLAAGHILNWKGKYPKWHHQCIIVNLKTWAENTKYEDIIEGEDPNMTMHSYNVSEENYHDDYTPMWIEGTKEELEPEEQDSTDYDDTYFNVMFKIATRQGLRIYNLPHEVREHKACIYIEDDIEETIEWLLDPTWLQGADVKTIVRERQNIEDKYIDKADLFTYKSQPFQILYATNTEGVPGEKIEIEGPFDVMAVPCSGLHQFLFMAASLDTLKKVIWFDFAELSTRWVQKLLNEWDGTDFTGFLTDNRSWLYAQNEILREGAETNIIYEEDLMLEFIETMGGEEEWLKKWDIIRNLNHEFLLLDIVKNGDKLVDRIGKGNRVFLNITNIWSYESNFINSKAFDAEAGFINLINNVHKNSEKLVIKGDAPSGQHFFEDTARIKGFIV